MVNSILKKQLKGVTMKFIVHEGLIYQQIFKDGKEAALIEFENKKEYPVFTIVESIMKTKK